MIYKVLLGSVVPSTHCTHFTGDTALGTSVGGAS